MIELRPMPKGTVCTRTSIRQGIFKDFDLVEDELQDKLNLACGSDYIQGYTNIDVDPSVKADVICDIDNENKLPFDDASFDLVYASHILEHITFLPALKREFKRIVRVGGHIVMIAPNYTSLDAWGDDTHVRAFSVMSFMSMYWPGFMVNHYGTIKAPGPHECEHVIGHMVRVTRPFKVGKC
jgi:SAM-dependent methyltransferase